MIYACIATALGLVGLVAYVVRSRRRSGGGTR